MDLIWAWPAAILALLITAGILIGARRRQRADGTPIAGHGRLTELPEYVRALRRHRLLLLAGLALGVICLLAALLGAARPVAITTVDRSDARRDVVLCLDASTSMDGATHEIIEAYADLLDRLDDTRVALRLFNSSAVTVFPLTDDRRMAQDMLREAADRLGPSGYGGYLEATTIAPGASLIGDGVVSCAQGFDRAEEERSRSIILATDNDVGGDQVFTIAEAADLLAERDIRLYALSVPSSESGRVPTADLDSATARTGGQHMALDDTSASTVIDLIDARETSLTPGAGITVAQDRPELPLLVLLVGLPAVLVLLRWSER